MKENVSFAFSGRWLGLKYFKGKTYLVDISALAVGKDSLNEISLLYNQHQYLFCLNRVKPVLSRSYESLMQLNLCITLHCHTLCIL